MTKVNLLQPIRNKTSNGEPDAVTYSRTVQIEFVPEQVDQGEGQYFGGEYFGGEYFGGQNVQEPAVEGQMVEIHGMDEVEVDPVQIEA